MNAVYPCRLRGYKAAIRMAAAWRGVISEAAKAVAAAAAELHFA
jgi:hypothetical protein